jgi:HlyD family secretion protein
MRLAKASAWLLVIVVVAVGLTIYFQPFADASKQASAGSPAPPAAASVGCLGRIEPGDGVVRIAARSLSGQPSIVGKLLVAERDQVRTGQVLAELDSTNQLRETILLAEARLEVARKRLDQVRAGARPSDIAAQRAEVERLDAELENAQKDLRRYQGLREKNSVADASLDTVRLKADSLTRLRQQARERLASLSEVRPVDVAVAQAELDAGLREVSRVRAEYASSLILAPIDGRVLKIHAWPGEEVGPSGVMELANTDRMYVLAEVSEGDMSRVRPGQRARVSGYGLPAPLTGTVETVGLQVTQNSLLKLDPAEFSDARVVEVKIRLDDGARVAQLIHLRVNVLIGIAAAGKEGRDGR